MISPLGSLRVGGVALAVVAFFCGVGTAALWLSSKAAWDKHLLRAEQMGVLIFESVRSDRPLPSEVSEVVLSQSDQARAEAGEFERMRAAPSPIFVTYLTATPENPADRLASGALRIAILSPDLVYPISEIDQSGAHSLPKTMGDVTALIATYCSDALLLVSFGETAWRGVRGDAVWSCDAAPNDNRLAATLLGFLALFSLGSIAVNTAAQFTAFAELLQSRRRIGAADDFAREGPEELQAIIAAVNDYRDTQRQHLADRAMVLSGVSHDLGTPALRLKLRSELIADEELRKKFDSDIDQMTGIIESVLTYTRAELNTEEPRRVSLTSLIDATVADYADIDKPVIFEKTERVVIKGGQSIFMSRRGSTELTDTSQVIVHARPIALQRALSNLIDNALKYGRRAAVRLETEATQVHILVEDEGGPTAISEINALTAPFQRGKNATPIPGYGMGLTIASTIALEHGGSLSFAEGKAGLIARLTIARG
ncbi:sensor histidine kinase [Yoonia litorea]|uniref:histidine kinase n=1 Tax=Yoonia litorea TaxID=1123755 RepID=A0A1I6N134_9RHOB|nr:ATP-binding protein [Yoonia litorea]SFS21581.1 Signal transduction histidine kinase [Yoonia litorea]